MSVLVERSDHSNTYNGKSHQSSVRNATPVKGSSRDKKSVKTSVSGSSGVAGTRNGTSEAEEMNMMAVQRVDSCVCRLLATVPQVVLYQYETASNIWVSHWL